MPPGEKDLTFNRELVRRGMLTEGRLLELLDQTPIDEDLRGRMRDQIAKDFRWAKEVAPAP